MSLVGIVKDLSKDSALKHQYILSARFNTDPLENFFGKIRQSGGWSSNPSSKAVQDATDIIRLQKSSVLDEVRSSSKAKRRIFANAPPQVDDTPLPKQKRKASK